MPGRCVAGGCSAFPDVERGLVLHAIPFYNGDRPEARKRRKKWVDFVKQKRAKWEPTRNSSLCSRHFTEDDFIRRFTFADETSGKPIIPRLKRDELGINAVSVTLIQQQPQTSTRKPRHCTVCKQPMKGHKNVTNCPRNQPPAEWWTSLTASLWSHLSILFWAFWCPSLCMLSIVQ